MCRRRACKPRSYVPIEPRLLLIRFMDRHEWAEAVRTHVAGDDHEIAWRNLRQEPVLVAERHDSHVTLITECRIVRHTKRASSLLEDRATAGATVFVEEHDRRLWLESALLPWHKPCVRPLLARPRHPSEWGPRTLSP